VLEEEPLSEDRPFGSRGLASALQPEALAKQGLAQGLPARLPRGMFKKAARANVDVSALQDLTARPLNVSRNDPQRP
jgi:hypothetical protein